MTVELLAASRGEVERMSTVLTEVRTMADLLRELGVSADRVRMRPAFGNATEEDVIAVRDREKRLCELIDGYLVEKVMGHYESRLAIVLGAYLESYLRTNNIGYVLGADGFMRKEEREQDD